MNNENLGPENIQPTKRVSGIWPKFKISLVVLSLFGLITMNVLTLVNDQIHAVGYGFIEALIASTATDAVVSRVLSGSPTATKQRAVSVNIAKNAAVTKQFTDLSIKHLAVTKQFSDHSIKHVAVAKLLTDLSIKHTDLAKTYAETEAKHATLKHKSEKRSSLVSSISKRIGTRAAFNAARNLSSLAPKLVPVFGVPVIISMTGFDLQDACQSMKDVNELNVEFELQSEDADKVCGLNVPTFGK